MGLRKEHKFVLVGLLAVIGIYLFSFYFLPSFFIQENVQLSPNNSSGNSSSEDCQPDWECTDWIPQDCDSGTQSRHCYDGNFCGTDEDKPDEERDCPRCEPNWVCSDWQPEECSEKGQELKRECEDENNCGVSTDKPKETKTCEVQGNGFNWKYVAIVLLVLAIPITVFIVLFFGKYFNE